MSSLDSETGRDRYFEARDRELAALVDPETGRLASHLGETIDCPLCGSPRYGHLFTKDGFDFVRCADCTLVYVNPQLKESLVLDEYRTAESADLWFDVLTSPRQQEIDRAKFSEILHLLEAYRGAGRILDVGCSIGLFLDLAREQGWEGVGIELAPRALAHAHEHYGLEVLDVPLARAGLEPEAFDAVTLLSVLEHTNDPRGVLAESARVLRRGGALYLVVPNVESLACRVLHENARTFDGRNHLMYFSRATLADLLERSSFQPRLVKTAITSLDPIVEWLCYEPPYSGAATGGDRLARWLSGREDELAELFDELHLGYKVHCLATKRG